jgi:CelD/BcsL family acetyltransferase involved in cellulose biosynthesis
MLERACKTDLPFQTWEWSTSWWKFYREDRVAIRDSLRVCVVRKGTHVVGVAPFILTERPAVGPVRVRTLQLIGADPNITEIRSILCHPDHTEECYAALLEHFASTDDEWDWAVWEAPDDQLARLERFVRSREKLMSKEERHAFVLNLPSTWHGFLTGLHRSIRGLVRKYYRDLAAAGLDTRFEVVDDPIEIPTALDDFFRLNAEREASKGTRGQTELFASGRAQAFVRDTCAVLGERGATKIFRLWAGDNLVATRVGFQFGERLYLYYSGWDPAFSQQPDDRARGGDRPFCYNRRTKQCSLVDGPRSVEDALEPNGNKVS